MVYTYSERLKIRELKMDKNLQIFYNSFTEILQQRRILIFNYRLHKATNPIKANSE